MSLLLLSSICGVRNGFLELDWWWRWDHHPLPFICIHSSATFDFSLSYSPGHHHPLHDNHLNLPQIRSHGPSHDNNYAWTNPSHSPLLSFLCRGHLGRAIVIKISAKMVQFHFHVKFNPLNTATLTSPLSLPPQSSPSRLRLAVHYNNHNHPTIIVRLGI